MQYKTGLCSSSYVRTSVEINLATIEKLNSNNIFDLTKAIKISSTISFSQK